MKASLDRHLKNKGCTLSIVRDREFSSSKEVLEDKAKQLRLAGRGKRANKARQVSEEKEEILWKSGKLGKLVDMWWYLQHLNIFFFACSLRMLTPCESDFKAITQFFHEYYW